MIRSFKYPLIIAVVAIIAFGIYRIATGHPDYPLFVLPLLLVGFYMRQRGLARYKELTQEERKDEQ